MTRLEELFAKVDAFFARAAQRFPRSTMGLRPAEPGSAPYPAEEGITCHPGCAECCHHRFSVTAVEAEAIAAALDALPTEVRARLAERAANGDEGVCPALESDGRCAVYEARPVICRTHGLPIRFRDARSLPVLDACPKNFSGRDIATLPADTVLDQTTLSTLLGAIDAARAAELGRPKGERVAIADILRGEGPLGERS